MTGLLPDSSLTDGATQTTPSPTPTAPAAPTIATPPPAAPAPPPAPVRAASTYVYDNRDPTKMTINGAPHEFVHDDAGFRYVNTRDKTVIQIGLDRRTGRPVQSDGRPFDQPLEVWLWHNINLLEQRANSVAAQHLRDYVDAIDAREKSLGVGRDLVARIETGQQYAAHILENHERWRGEVGQKANEWYNYTLAMRVWVQGIAGQLPEANRPTHLNRLEWNVLNFSGKATNKLSGPETQEAAANLLAELTYTLHSVPKDKRGEVLQTVMFMGAAAYSILKHAGQEKDLVARAIDGLASTVGSVDKDTLKATYDGQLVAAYETAVRGA